MNKKKIKLLVFLIVLGSTSFILSFLILPSRALAEEDEKKVNLVLNFIGFSIAKHTLSEDFDFNLPEGVVEVEFMYNVIEYISLGAGLMFIQKGGEFTTTVYDNGRTLLLSTINEFNYLAIPIIVHFQAELLEGFIPFALFSLEPSFLLFASAKTTFRVSGIKKIIKEKVEDITDDLERFDFGIGFGAGIKLPLTSSVHFSSQVKYILGLTNIAKSGEGEMKNRAFVTLLGVGFPIF